MLCMQWSVCLSRRIFLYICQKSLHFSQLFSLRSNHSSLNSLHLHTQRIAYLDSQAYCFGEHNMSIMAVRSETEPWTQQALSDVASATELQETLGGTMQQRHTFTDATAGRAVLSCWRPSCLQGNWLSFKWFLLKRNCLVLDRRRSRGRAWTLVTFCICVSQES